MVALDPRTGAILAMVEQPVVRPEPDLLARPGRIRAEYNRLADDPADPLLNRAINQRYPPGSTFKVVTAAAALENGRTPDTQIDCPRRYRLPQTTRRAAQLRRRAVQRRTR